MLIVTSSLVTNGGTTFVLRLAKELKERKQPIAVILLTERQDEKFRAALAQVCPVIHISDLVRPAWRLLAPLVFGIGIPFNACRIRSIVEKYGSHIHVLGVWGLLFALHARRSCKEVRVSAGVYHVNEFRYKWKRHGGFHRHIRGLIRQIPEENMVFFNSYSRELYERHFNRGFAASPVLPIGIADPGIPQPHAGNGSPGPRIVSIGSLSGFKVYNNYMLDAVATCLAECPGISYDIYGGGEQEEFLRARIKELRLESVARLRGPIPYGDIPAVLSGADLFVGSGTAVLEAGIAGVPSLTAIDAAPGPFTYGFLSEIAGYDYNEYSPGRYCTTYENALRRFLSMSPEQRSGLASESRRKALEFTIEKTADGFLQMESRLVPWGRRRFPLAAIFPMLSLMVDEKTGLDRTFASRRNQDIG